MNFGIRFLTLLVELFQEPREKEEISNRVRIIK